MQVLESTGQRAYNSDVQGQEKKGVPAPGESEFTFPLPFSSIGPPADWMVPTCIEGGPSPLIPPTHMPVSSGNAPTYAPKSNTFPAFRHSLIQLSGHQNLTVTVSLPGIFPLPPVSPQDLYMTHFLSLYHSAKPSMNTL